MSDAFALLGLTPSMGLTRKTLEDHLRRALLACHPDRFVGQDEEAQRKAAEKACALNQAFAVLKDPVKRAHTLGKLLGHGEDTPPLDSAFLATSFALQEELEDNPACVQTLIPLIEAEEDALENAFSQNKPDLFAIHLGRYRVLKRLQENAHAPSTS